MKISKLLPWPYVDQAIKMIQKKKGVLVAGQTVMNYVNNEKWEHRDVILEMATKHQKKLKRLKEKAEKLNKSVPKPKKNNLNLVGKS